MEKDLTCVLDHGFVRHGKKMEVAEFAPLANASS